MLFFSLGGALVFQWCFLLFRYTTNDTKNNKNTNDTNRTNANTTSDTNTDNHDANTTKITHTSNAKDTNTKNHARSRPRFWRALFMGSVLGVLLCFLFSTVFLFVLIFVGVASDFLVFLMCFVMFLCCFGVVFCVFVQCRLMCAFRVFGFASFF